MTELLKMYGLEECSTVRKARAELREAGREVEFRDVRADPLSVEERRDLLAQFGDKLVNRASLTWRHLSEDERMRDPVELLGDKPALLKRPAIVAGDRRLLGWTANVRRALGLQD